ncbi:MULTISPECIES: hypothetical protein [unclassified Tolypothrix]|nr:MULTISPECIES: hypothetical protein [unclassified Tolypothrix]EKE97358.1 hypothetical protein FDUTEX481_05066 [Tolypothrix sp. PCC 7601]
MVSPILSETTFSTPTHPRILGSKSMLTGLLTDYTLPSLQQDGI